MACNCQELESFFVCLKTLLQTLNTQKELNDLKQTVIELINKKDVDQEPDEKHECNMDGADENGESVCSICDDDCVYYCD